jgi:hypothetical protein
MAMAMLRAGGVQFVAGSDPDTGELPGIGPDSFDVPLEGRAVKLLDYILWDDLPPVNWRFIWLDRDPMQQARSTAKFMAGIGGITGVDVDKLADSYGRDRPKVLAKLRGLGPVLTLDYERVLAQPKRAARQMALFLAGSRDGEEPVPAAALTNFDVRAAAAVVHQRDGRCRPDLAFEESLRRPAS